ncbi:hypothetical protein [Moraxella sp. K2450]|uniref:hypothetical protein n=1 Tax=Moraxella sp. K2450 TaxID=2780076 RepID=UPI0018803A8D|nr:hypothetical protein [Moraxella sp. K2450]MBE9597161.1 hypothetical protein [Moraxella sp. K2450]
MSVKYHNPATGQTATTADSKADKDGNICICIDETKYTQINYHDFISNFNSIITERHHEHDRH